MGQFETWDTGKTWPWNSKPPLSGSKARRAPSRSADRQQEWAKQEGGTAALTGAGHGQGIILTHQAQGLALSPSHTRLGSLLCSW